MDLAILFNFILWCATATWYLEHETFAMLILKPRHATTTTVQRCNPTMTCLLKVYHVGRISNPPCISLETCVKAQSLVYY
jgi:hypothetical protein